MKSTKKQLYTTVLGLGLLNVLSSCNDSFMDRFPETSITEKVFFQNGSVVILGGGINIC